MVNPVVCFDVGYSREVIDGVDEQVIFVLDDEGREVKRWVGYTGPYICSDQELIAKDWVRQQGAAVNYLPSWLHHSETRTADIVGMFV